METLKTAVIGTGNMGRHHVRVYSELPESELVGIADIDLKQAQEYASKYNTNAYKDYKEMLSKEKPDCVSIAVPTGLHTPIGLETLAKTNTLIEKPIAENRENADKLIQKSREQDKKLMIGQIERFNPAVQYIKENFPSEDLLALNIMRLGIAPPPTTTTGVILDLSIHDIDLFRYLTKEEIVDAKSCSKNLGATDFEDHAHLFLQTENNKTASLIANWINPRKVRHMYITMKKSFLYANFITQKIIIYKPNGEEKTTIEVPHKEPLKEEIKEFISSIKENREPIVTGEDAKETLLIALKAK